MTPLLVLASCACLVGSPQSNAPATTSVAPSTAPAPAAPASTTAPSWRVGAAAVTTGAVAVATGVVGLVNVALALDLAEDSRQSVEGAPLRGADVVQAESALVATGVTFYAGLLVTALCAAGTVALVVFDDALSAPAPGDDADDAAAGAASTAP